MANDDKDEGGIVLGGISFGVGAAPLPTDKAGAGAADAAAAAKQPTSAPLELDDELLPLRVIAVADLVPRDEYNAGTNPPEQAVRVPALQSDELFKRLAPRLAIEVESMLAEGARARVNIAPTSIKSFRPDSLCAEIPLLRSLLDGKKVLERLRDGNASIDAATSELNRLWNGSPLVAKVLGGVQVRAASTPAAAAAPTPSAGDDSVLRILDMVDTGTTADASSTSAAAPVAAAPAATGGAKAKGRFGAFLAAVAHAGSGKPGANPDEGIRLIEKAVSVQLGAILQNPEFRRLEIAWRGVDFLVSRMPKTGVRLEVVSARTDAMAEALTRAVQANANIEPPVSLAIVDTTVDGTAPAYSRFRQLSEIAEENMFVLFSNADAGLLGHGDLDAIDRLDNKQALFDNAAQAPWRAEAQRPAAAWAALVLNRVLGRNAYDARATRIREAAVEELPAGEAGKVWLSPCWAVASLTLRSFGKWSWPHGITGPRDGGMIEDLPVHQIQLDYDGGASIAIPTEAFFSPETQRALGRIGVLALATQPNSDGAYLMSAATAYVPPPKRTYDYDSAEDQVRLPKAPLSDQLFVARLVQFLQALGGRVGADSDAREVQQVLEAAIAELFRDAPPSGPEISVEVNPGETGLSAAVTVRPRRFLGVQMEEITLGVPLG